jgi:hypothetical protein
MIWPSTVIFNFSTCSLLQVLHLYAAEKVIEKLEPPLQKDNPNPNLAQWLNHIRLSQNTIDLILSLRPKNDRIIKTRYIFCMTVYYLRW